VQASEQRFYNDTDNRQCSAVDDEGNDCAAPKGHESPHANVHGTWLAGDEDEFRIEFTITRRQRGQDEDDFTEIGFGSSGAWSSLDQCAHMVETAVQRREWETTDGMPDPEDV
jgi:hypothetical protein